MRFVLALLALMALIVSPVTVAAAQLACIHDCASMMQGMAPAAQTGMDRAGITKSSLPPCCDPAKAHGRRGGKACAGVCSGACMAMAAIRPLLVTFAQAHARARLAPGRLASIRDFKPDGLKRPPKSIV